MAVKFGNNAATLLASNASSSATVLTVSDGSVFPTLSGADYTYVTLEDVNSNREIVKLTAISGNELTVVRAQDGSSARAFSTADKCELRITAALLNAVSTETVNGTSARFKFTATANQTTFSGSDDNSVTLAYNVGYIDLYLSGIRLIAGSDYTASNGTSIVLAAGASVNDIIEIVSYGTFVLADIAINDMTDVNTTGVADGSILAYDNTDSRFEKSTILSQSSSGIAVVGNITATGTVDGRDVATDGTKLDGVETSADVTDATNVTAAGALMDSELTSIASVKALNQGVATTDSPTFAALTSTGEITANGGIALGDNDKATFGASDDLQIYHDGSNSYVTDTGTGNLYIRASNELALTSAAGEAFFLGIADGSSYLYHNGSVKLNTTSTGIDVTGTATMDGLTVDNSGTLVSFFAGDGLTQVLKITNDATYNCLIEGKINGNLSFKTKANGAGEGTYFLDTDNKKRMFIEGTTGDISFYEDTGSTAKLFWDASAESLGIGTSSPSGPLHVSGSTSTVPIKIDNTGTGGDTWRIWSTNDSASDGGGKLGFYNEDTATRAMTLDSSGRVGIGTSSPSSQLHLQKLNDTANSNIATMRFTDTDPAAATGQIVGRIEFEGDDTTSAGVGSYIQAVQEDTGNNHNLVFGTGQGGSATERMRIDSSGNVGIGTAAPDDDLHIANTAQAGATFRLENTSTSTDTNTVFGTINFEGNDASGGASGIRGSIVGKSESTNGALGLLFSTASGGGSSTERMRIDSSGNVGIGTNNPTSPLVLTADADSDDLMINIGNHKYSSVNATGESKIKFGWANHTAANIAAYKESVNRTGFKLYGEVGWNNESLALTVSSSGDLTPAGGIYLGGTGAANKLDDYEEGTWTPVHGGQNMGTDGRYTKVGQMVTLVLDATSHASATSSSSISGLPFTITSSHSAFNIGYTNSAAGLTGGYCSVNNNNLTFVVSGGISGQSLGASERVMLTATYVTTT